MNIHELNTKAITNPAYVALDDGSDTYKLDLNAKLSTMQSSISGAESDIVTAQADITLLQTNMGQAQGAISSAQGEIEDLQSDFNALSTQTAASIGNLQTEVDAVEDDVTDLKGETNELKEVLSQLETNLIESTYPYSIIENQYVETNGVITNYNGWDRTDKISCDGLTEVTIFDDNPTGTNIGGYNGFYQEDGTFISTISIRKQGKHIVPVPIGASYFILSSQRARLANIRVYLNFYNEILNNTSSFAKVYSIGAETYSEECTLIITKNGTAILVDSGDGDGQHTTDIVNKILSYGVTEIKNVVITHYHRDHVTNFPAISEAVDMTGCHFFIPPTPDTTKLDTTTLERYNTIQSLITSLGGTKVTPTEHQKVQIDNVILDFWNTVHTSYYTETPFDYNNCSLCFHLILGNMKYAFTGDIGYLAQTKNVRNVEKCNILQAFHHAQDRTTSPSYEQMNPLFMQCLEPDICHANLGSNFSSYYDTSLLALWCNTHNVPIYFSGDSNPNITFTITQNSWALDGYFESYETSGT